MKISLIHASRRHTDPLHNPVRKLWLERAHDPRSIEYLLSLDRHGTLERTWIELADGVRLVTCPNRGSVDAWNSCAEVATGDALIQLSDDFEPPQDWDAIVSADLPPTDRRSSGRLIWYHDGLQYARCTIAVMDRQRYEAQGCLLWPEYLSMYSDDDLTEWADLDGALIRRSMVVFPHRWGGGQGDDVYKWQNRPEAFEIGQRILERRRKEGFRPWPRPTSSTPTDGPERPTASEMPSAA
jgi:hypothetical protein